MSQPNRLGDLAIHRRVGLVRRPQRRFAASPGRGHRSPAPSRWPRARVVRL